MQKLFSFGLELTAFSLQFIDYWLEGTIRKFRGYKATLFVETAIRTSPSKSILHKVLYFLVFSHIRPCLMYLWPLKRQQKIILADLIRGNTVLASMVPKLNSRVFLVRQIINWQFLVNCLTDNLFLLHEFSDSFLSNQRKSAFFTPFGSQSKAIIL